MLNTQISVRFVLYKSKINKIGGIPIYCRITINGERSQFSTGLTAQPRFWNAKKQKFKAYNNENVHHNSELDRIKNKLDNIILNFKIQEIDFIPDDVINVFRGKKVKQKHVLIEYIEDYLYKKKELVGIDFKQSTYSKFKYAFAHVIEFVSVYIKKPKLEIKDLSIGFLQDFEYYLKVEKGNKQITINKTVQRFREVIRKAVAEGILKKDPFAEHKPRKVKKFIVFLTEDELHKLENFEFSQNRLEKIRDLFVFCCYTGLAYAEMKSLKTKNIQIGFDNKEWIKVTRQKTDREIAIPLLPKAKKILNKYASTENDKLLPEISNQRFNSYLKEIAGIVGINKKLTHHIARKTFATTVLLFNNVPIEIVSELLGHSSIRTTQDFYGKILKENISREMDKLALRLKK